MIRLLVTGGRDYSDALKVDLILGKYLKLAGPAVTDLLVIHGGARGLDTLAAEWCDRKGVPCIAMKAPWTAYNKAAGPIRNSWMIKYTNPTHCHVFPGGSGTEGTHKKAVEAGLVVRVTKANPVE